jgi:hypothetical protein
MAGKPVIDGSFRLSVGTREQMRWFCAALEEVVRPAVARRPSLSPR